MVQPLNTLACFNHIEAIEPITAGLSSQCYQVNADKKKFFAKQIANTIESTISQQAASKNISPNIIYHDQHWLITQFIDGNNLLQSQKVSDEKIVTAIKLMAQCHQLSARPVELKPTSIVHKLIRGTLYSSHQQADLLRVAAEITSPLKDTNNLVCCHGDLNFSNILVNQQNKAYLVDFECACAAPAEFDLAMFIAVNNIAKERIQIIIQDYKKYALIDIDVPLLQHYLSFCYLINGLWYIYAYHKNNLDKFTVLAKQQWQNIHNDNLMALLPQPVL